MNEERTGKCLRQVEHIRGHVPVNREITSSLSDARNNPYQCGDLIMIKLI